MNVLQLVLGRVREQAATQPVVVFDLDSTLFSTRERNFAILQEAAQVYPVIAPAIAGWTPANIGWGVIDDLRAAGITDASLLTEIRVFWRKRFFSGEYLAFDEPMPGAAMYVASLHEAGATICYLTARLRDSMENGTIASLTQNGFPTDGTRVQLLMRADFNETAKEYKMASITRLRELGAVTAAFDNEPEMVNLLADAFPAAIVVFFQSVHSPDTAETYSHLPRISDFEL